MGGDEGGAHWLLAMRFANKAFAPIPGLLTTFRSRGALGTTTFAAWPGLWRGWMGVATGESLGVDVADIMEGDGGKGGARVEEMVMLV